MSESVTPPEMTPVKSSNVEAVGHDGSALWVRFHGGGMYRYPTAGPEHHAALLEAESPGQYLHRHIKGAHAGEKVGG